MANSSQGRQHQSNWAVVRSYLVERDLLFARIRDDRRLPRLLLHMMALSALFSAIYGVTVGLYAGGWQPLYNAIKFPWMLLSTLGLCVLALYMLNSLLGSRLSLQQTTAVVLSAMLVTTTLLVALTPPLGFLMLTSLDNYPLVLLMNLIVIMLAGAGGSSFAWQATEAVHEEDAVRRSSLSLMKAWMVLYGLVGLQMLWLFRPYFRATEVFIRPLGEGGNAFEAFAEVVLTVVKSLL